MKNKILIIGMGEGALLKATELALLVQGLPKTIEVVNLNELSPEDARKKLEDVYPKEKEEPFVFKAPEPFQEIFIEKPVKPRHNSRRHNGKKNFF